MEQHASAAVNATLRTRFMERRNWCWDVIGALTLLTPLECGWLAEFGEDPERKTAA